MSADPLRGERSHRIGAYNFKVEISGVTVGAFTAMSGLEIEESEIVTEMIERG